ncbi:MAG: alpha/beta hydrolase [Bacteroidia bacterium]
MKKHEVEIRKTARYFSLGEANTQVEEVWFVCHGYAQSASEFLESFSALEKPGRLLIAPEGLHRFYGKGSAGKVVASWMTSEDRLTDIADYIAWLDTVAAEVLKQVPDTARIVVLGFSQGAATVSRWLAAGNTLADELVLWCGFFPPDMQPATLPETIRLTVLTASDDRFITPEQSEEQLEQLKQKQIQFQHLHFQGTHTIEQTALQQLADWFVN